MCMNSLKFGHFTVVYFFNVLIGRRVWAGMYIYFEVYFQVYIYICGLIAIPTKILWGSNYDRWLARSSPNSPAINSDRPLHTGPNSPAINSDRPLHTGS